MSVGRTFTIELPFIPDESLRGNSRTPPRYATRERQVMRQSGKDHGVALLASHGLSGPIGQYRVQYTVWHDRESIDLGNVHSGFKAFIDGLQDADFLVDDNVKWLLKDCIQWGGKVAKGESRTIVCIREIV